MGFPSKWRKWIMECVTPVSALVLVNDNPTDEFRFGLSGDLYKGYLVGDDMDQQMHISHLQFADDTLMVNEKSWGNISVLKAMLILFELISDLK
ncbi:LINE-1 reverse transcriptase like, partial [Trifolium medium]|nr:LINE-1 reverse transcriptase like [Trifolium medium]